MNVFRTDFGENKIILYINKNFQEKQHFQKRHDSVVRQGSQNPGHPCGVQSGDNGPERAGAASGIVSTDGGEHPACALCSGDGQPGRFAAVSPGLALFLFRSGGGSLADASRAEPPDFEGIARRDREFGFPGRHRE